jgi:DNA (cytosine-5)-methyltransferase 1
VIDLFAGPGGLGEGFSSLRGSDGHHRFRIALSIEKDPAAHGTLELRAFFRQFAAGAAPAQYYALLRGEPSRSALFAAFPNQAQAARQEAWLAELGAVDATLVNRRISVALSGATRWLLIGGPPCQAYSVVGRARNSANPKYKPENDARHTLYLQYLKIIAEHWPPVFVMENVIGLLSARLHDQQLFQRILQDLMTPAASAKRGAAAARSHTYRIVALTPQRSLLGFEPGDYIVRAERHGVPQARHRLILVGVRDDLSGAEIPYLQVTEPVAAHKVLDDLPRIRSGLTDGDDGPDQWIRALTDIRRAGWATALPSRSDLARELRASIDSLRRPKADLGSQFISHEGQPAYRSDWFVDRRLGGVCNHFSKSHMREDLHRYFFAACFARVFGRSPTLVHFPPSLRPAHANVGQALGGKMFADRFRVQLRESPATTITSHISRDGHYYIHYDPTQCRTLTVREAARLQTFPDNYLFCGNRTAQYRQVGNAVPPLLAVEIARSVAALFT